MIQVSKLHPGNIGIVFESNLFWCIRKHQVMKKHSLQLMVTIHLPPTIQYVCFLHSTSKNSSISCQRQYHVESPQQDFFCPTMVYTPHVMQAGTVVGSGLACNM